MEGQMMDKDEIMMFVWSYLLAGGIAILAIVLLRLLLCG